MMFGRPVGTIAACALGARAFLIPAGIEPTTPDDRFPSDLTVNVVDPTHQIVRVLCPSCAFGSTQEKVEGLEDDDLFSIQGGANDLLLNFTISEDRQTLEANGVAIYPYELSSLTPQNIAEWSVLQVPASASLDDIEAGAARTVPVTITGLQIGVEREEQTESGDMILDVRFGIKQLNDIFIPVDGVLITLLELHQSDVPELLMLSTGTIHDGNPYVYDDAPEDDMRVAPHPMSPHGPPSPPSEGMHKDCGMLPIPLCRFKHMMESKIEGMRHGEHGRPGCAGRKGGRPYQLPGHIKGPKFPIAEDDETAHHHHHDGPPPPMGAPEWSHHSHKHHFIPMLVKSFVAVLIPIMAGIAVGMTVSLVGMLVGRLVSAMWIRFVRGNRRGYASVAVEEPEGEKEAMPAEMEAPPAYEDAPTYESSEKE